VRLLRYCEDWLFAAERVALYFCLSLVAALSFLQVLLRQLGQGLVWADTLLHQLVLSLGFLGTAAAARQEAHFAVDAVARLLPERAHYPLIQTGRSLGALASFALAHAAWKFVAGEWAARSVLFELDGLRVPAAPFQLVLPAGFLLAGLHFLMRLADPPHAAPEGQP